MEYRIVGYMIGISWSIIEFCGSSYGISDYIMVYHRIYGGSRKYTMFNVRYTPSELARVILGVYLVYIGIY